MTQKEHMIKLPTIHSSPGYDQSMSPNKWRYCHKNLTNLE